MSDAAAAAASSSSAVAAAADQYPLHHAVYAKDMQRVRELIAAGADVNGTDHVGARPLHIAVQHGDVEMAKLLIEHCADSTLKNNLLWNCRADASYYGHVDLMTRVFYGDSVSMHRRFEDRLPILAAAWKGAPDFYMELKWGIDFAVPFLKGFAPSDHYKIWKRGNQLRCDLTLLNVGADMKVIRGAQTWFVNIDDNKTVMIYDHMQKEYCNAAPAWKDPNIRDIELSAYKMVQRPSMQWDINTHESVVEQAKGMFGKAKTEAVGGFQKCHVYHVRNVRFTMVQRPPVKKDAPGVLDCVPEEEYFAGPGNGTCWRTLPPTKTSVKKRTFTVWMAPNPPMNASVMMPLLEVVAPTPRHWQNFSAFLEHKLPSMKDELPVQIDVPIVPRLVSVKAHVPVLIVRTVHEREVTPPAGYKEQTHEGMYYIKMRRASAEAAHQHAIDHQVKAVNQVFDDFDKTD